MTDFFTRLAAQELGMALVVRPRIAPRFAPGPDLGIDGLTEGLPETPEENAQHPPAPSETLLGSTEPSSVPWGALPEDMPEQLPDVSNPTVLDAPLASSYRQPAIAPEPEAERTGEEMTPALPAIPASPMPQSGSPEAVAPRVPVPSQPETPQTAFAQTQEPPPETVPPQPAAIPPPAGHAGVSAEQVPPAPPVHEPPLHRRTATVVELSRKEYENLVGVAVSATDTHAMSNVEPQTESPDSPEAETSHVNEQVVTPEPLAPPGTVPAPSPSAKSPEQFPVPALRESPGAVDPLAPHEPAPPRPAAPIAASPSRPTSSPAASAGAIGGRPQEESPGEAIEREPRREESGVAPSQEGPAFDAVPPPGPEPIARPPGATGSVMAPDARSAPMVSRPAAGSAPPGAETGPPSEPPLLLPPVAPPAPEVSSEPAEAPRPAQPQPLVPAVPAPEADAASRQDEPQGQASSGAVPTDEPVVPPDSAAPSLSASRPWDPVFSLPVPGPQEGKEQETAEPMPASSERPDLRSLSAIVPPPQALEAGEAEPGTVAPVESASVPSGLETALVQRPAEAAAPPSETLEPSESINQPGPPELETSAPVPSRPGLSIAPTTPPRMAAGASPASSPSEPEVPVVSRESQGQEDTAPPSHALETHEAEPWAPVESVAVPGDSATALPQSPTAPELSAQVPQQRVDPSQQASQGPAPSAPVPPALSSDATAGTPQSVSPDARARSDRPVQPPALETETTVGARSESLPLSQSTGPVPPSDTGISGPSLSPAVSVPASEGPSPLGEEAASRGPVPPMPARRQTEISDQEVALRDRERSLPISSPAEVKSGLVKPASDASIGASEEARLHERDFMPSESVSVSGVLPQHSAEPVPVEPKGPERSAPQTASPETVDSHDPGRQRHGPVSNTALERTPPTSANSVPYGSQPPEPIDTPIPSTPVIEPSRRETPPVLVTEAPKAVTTSEVPDATETAADPAADSAAELPPSLHVSERPSQRHMPQIAVAKESQRQPIETHTSLLPSQMHAGPNRSAPELLSPVPPAPLETSQTPEAVPPGVPEAPGAGEADDGDTNDRQGEDDIRLRPSGHEIAETRPIVSATDVRDTRRLRRYGAESNDASKPPTVRVSIGRINVALPPPPETSRKVGRPRPSLSLESYLEQRRGRSR
jgi:hypothetical protein